MNLSTTVNSERFWERLWRSSGIIFVVFFVIAYVMYGLQPKVGASAETLVSFYDGQSTRILMATLMFGSAVLLLLWFAAAIRSTLHDAGQGGWGAAATASSAALGGCSGRSSQWARPWRTRSPAPETTRSRPDCTTSCGCASW